MQEALKRWLVWTQGRGGEGRDGFHSIPLARSVLYIDMAEADWWHSECVGG